jgi:hypothetical protein
VTEASMIWIADGRTYGYCTGRWLIQDGNAWRVPTKQECNDRRDWSPQLVHASTG